MKGTKNAIQATLPSHHTNFQSMPIYQPLIKAYQAWRACHLAVAILGIKQAAIAALERLNRLFASLVAFGAIDTLVNGFLYIFIMAYMVAGLIDSIIGANGILAGLISLAFIIPNLAVTARRLHDINKSGW